MQQRALGSSGFEISTIGVGTWAIGGWMWVGQVDARASGDPCSHRHGVNWIDTAPITAPDIRKPSSAARTRAARVAAASRLHKVRARRQQGRRGERPRRAPMCSPNATRAFGGSAWTPSTVPVPLAGRSADPGNRGRLRRAVEGRQDPRGRRVELLGRAARAVVCTGVPLHSLQPPYSILRPAAGAMSSPGAATHRRHLLFAAVPRAPVRNVEEGQDVPRRARPGRAQGLPRRALPATPGCDRRMRSSPRQRPELRQLASGSCCTRPG